QISAALSVAHRKGIVHRDLKPANILLDEERNAYLTDFGIAKDVEHSSDVDDDEDDDSIVGTPAYSPPEQLQSLQPTPQSDIYSFGLIIYELLTGHDAMAGDSVSDAIRNQLYEQLPDIDPVTYNIPPMINEILATATAKNPDDRYRDIMHFARDFRHAVSGFKSSPSVTLDKDTGEMVVVPEDTVSFVIDINDLSPNTTGAQMIIVNPYKGLRAFQESDASDFHGRKDLTEQLIERLNEDRADARFLAVIGPSGSGKSSVVKAGLIPALRDGALPDSENFYVAEMVPSIDALEELESVLLSLAIDPPANVREQLASSETALFDLLKQILPDDGSELFLLIDQFEEIFTQTEDNAVRTHFMNSLQYAVTHPESRLWAVITIRADFYDKPLLYPKFGELVRERGEIVLPLSRNELEAAIVEPAKSMRVEIEPELIAQIIADVQEEPGALPLLQYALTELFDRRSGMLMTLSSYRESGGVLGSLARRAEELYLEMDEAHQEAIRQMFLRLVTLGEGTEDTRRRVRWSELSFYDGIDDPMANVRDLFTKYRLLTGDNDPQTREPTVEVAHEALIRQWQRLRNWLADNRENIRIQRQVVGAVHEWQQNEQDDSFLATGMRLNQFELLLQNSDIALTIDEKAYIEASIEQREARIREEQKRQAREQALRDRARRFLQLFSATTTIGLVIASGL
ncbi:MAG: serine/threonine-protein kinase, partial [Chloroflexota bacterium]